MPRSNSAQKSKCYKNRTSNKSFENSEKSEGPSAGAMKDYSTLVSITIRTGRGVNLGSDSSMALEEFIRYKLPKGTFYSFSVEKEGASSHWQGAIKGISPFKLSNLRENIKGLYREHDPEWNEKNEEHAIKVSKHENWMGLVGYTMKERFPEFKLLEYYCHDSIDSINPYQAYYRDVVGGKIYLSVDGEIQLPAITDVRNKSSLSALFRNNKSALEEMRKNAMVKYPEH